MMRSDDAVLTTTVREAWDDGAVIDARIEALTPLGDWRVALEMSGTIVNIWNARIVSRSGERYVIEAEDYNAQVAAGSAASFGFEMAGTGDILIADFAVDRAADLAAASAVRPPDPTEDAQAGNDPVADPPQAPGTPLADTAPPGPSLAAPDAPPGASSVVGPGAGALSAGPAQLREGTLGSGGAPIVNDLTVQEPAGDGAGLPGASESVGPLFTEGAKIVDATGQEVALHGLNWFGLETEISVPHGLWARNWREIMDEVRSLGFNTLRIPFSGELVASGGGEPSGIDPGFNPDLIGLNGLQILDAVVDYADTIGLSIILDYHRGSPGGGPNENGLWFGNGRTEADVVSEWRTMAERYKDDPAVIGADLINEPFLGTWGDGSATDWAAAAERIGNAIQSIAPHWLIVVEGVSTYDGDSYWWGGNLQGVRDRPVRLDVPNKLVYSPHDYPASVHPQDWFFDGSDLTEKFRENWGYIVEEGIAPVIVGEWGSRLETHADLRWADALSTYLRAHDIPWVWWSLNPNSDDTGGLYEDDWHTVRQPVVDLLDPFLDETQPQIPFDEVASVANDARFTVQLPAPAEDDISVKYATTDGTAEAGSDYQATAGSLTFAPGETEQAITVAILPDAEVEGDEFFYLILGGGGAVRGSASALISDNERRLATSALPLIDVASTVVPEGTGAAQFRVLLTEPAPSDVVITFETQAATASGQDFQSTTGTLTIPSGAREVTLEVAVDDDGAPEAAEMFTLELTAADGAVIRGGTATALIPAEPAWSAELDVASPTSEAQLTINVILENDWGTGALFNVQVKNVSDTRISAWQIALDLPFDIAEMWSAELVDDQGARVAVKNAEWNGAIEPGQSVNFGFISDVGDIALGDLLDDADLAVIVQ